MNLSRNLLIGAALTGLLLSGCTSKVTEKTQYSGFLSVTTTCKKCKRPAVVRRCAG
jgi:outer membrane murein-binding lipoprotein Lpp